MNIEQPRVLIVDDDAAVRKSLGRLMYAHDIPCRAFESSEDFLADYDPAVPGCVLLDLSLGSESGLALQATLASRPYALPIVFMSGCASVPDSVCAMKSGAVEFLLKPVDETALVNAVREAFALDRAARLRRAEINQVQVRMQTLTPREHEVLRSVLNGKLNKQTAAEFGISEKTIKVHRARVMEKLGARTLVDLFHLVARAEQTDAFSRGAARMHPVG